MRLRSSQFVFLLLLACCVQVGDARASQILSAAIHGQNTATSAVREASAILASSHPLRRNRSAEADTLELDSASLAVRRTAWTVRPPALESSAVISFTGFLRA